MKHGTGGYASGCRCQVCRDATAAYRRRKRAEDAPAKTPRPEPEPLATVTNHGTDSGYTQGCRAACCRAAMSQAQKRRRARNAVKAARGTTLPEGRRPSPGTATAPGVVRYVADLPPGVGHGTSSAYTYWACRCLVCTEGNNARRRAAARRRVTAPEEQP